MRKLICSVAMLAAVACVGTGIYLDASERPSCCGKVAICCQSGPDIMRDMINPAVEVRTAHGSGTGVALDIGAECYVLTAAHVVDGSKVVTLVAFSECDNQETYTQGDVVRVSKTYDLALVKPRVTAGFIPATLASDPKLVRGEDCWYVGCPQNVHRSLEKSIINRPLYRGENGQTYVLTNGNGWYGNSGGPLFVVRDGKYVVVGIMVRLAAVTENTPLCAEGPEHIKAFLDECKCKSCSCNPCECK